MCTSIVINKKKTLVGWNLDILNMEHRVRPMAEGVYIEVNDPTEGWMPLFGANSRGDFVGMPTCWPADSRSDPRGGAQHIIHLDIDLLLQKKTLAEVRQIAETENICSVPGLTFMGALSDEEGNVLHIVPGQGCHYYEKPDFAVLTNFSPFKENKGDEHPWMGMDRYELARELLINAEDNFDVKDCFAVLKAVSQEVCPTMVSMVFDVTDRKVYWCLERQWSRVEEAQL